jgi:hypothetical protein
LEEGGLCSNLLKPKPNNYRINISEKWNQTNQPAQISSNNQTPCADICCEQWGTFLLNNKGRHFYFTSGNFIFSNIKNWSGPWSNY